MKTLMLAFLLARLTDAAELRVTLYDRSGLGADQRDDVMAHSARILRLAGLDVIWLKAGTGTDHEATATHVSGTRGCLRVEIAAELITRADRQAGPAALGLALPFSCTGLNVRLFRDRIDAAAERQNLSASVVAAHALAHEIGHVLLGNNSHSIHGLMSARWDSDAYNRMRVGALRFTPHEALVIRTALDAGSDHVLRGADR